MPANTNKTAKRRGSGRQWQKGESGNPAGRPKRVLLLEDALFAFMEAEDPERNKLRFAVLLEATYEQAAAGNVTALRELLDRLLGKPTQHVDIDAGATRAELERIARQHGRSVEDVQRDAERLGLKVMA